MSYELTPERRQLYRETSVRARERKLALQKHPRPSRLGRPKPRLNPLLLMPRMSCNGFSALSLFSGGGGLDLGFERAGFAHVASYDVLEICGATLRRNRPAWKVHSGEDGNVEGVRWSKYRGVADIIHGGPPCQPFSVAGKQLGGRDPRNMWPAFVSAVLGVRPRAFVAENVPGFLDPKFARFVADNVVRPLQKEYTLLTCKLSADGFGVPQARKRVFIIGFRYAQDYDRFSEPENTHANVGESTFGIFRANTARWSLGLPDIGFDTLAPTLRSGFTGPRNTTGVLNSKASLAIWNRLEIWPNGVQKSADLAAVYPPENGHHRLTVADCALLQGFPGTWRFEGAVYQALGQIGNSVCPPVAYRVARSVAAALGGK